ncbi:Gene late control D protein [Escherichia coli]|uniref:Gene late control D protein n=1 Tax=Escherichia coli TaxID=562 RepID=A0A377AGI3_ECOLX|nr:Gene late control D protein [Escherichia coli]
MPDFDILAEGKTLSGVAERLMSLSLTDNRGFEADQLTITLDDADGQLQLPPRGARLTVLIGWKGEPLTEKGTYIVDEIAHEGPPDRLTVSARSADFRDEFNVKREVSWHDVTVERVVSAIAHRYGLKPQISEMLMDIEIDHADQTEESDMSFLTRMAEMLGAITTVKSGNLLFIMPGGGVNAQGQPLPSFAITRSSGDRHQFRIADREAYTGVRAYWLDLNYGKKKKVSVKRRKPPKPKRRKAAAVKVTIWKARMAMCLCYARLIRTSRQQDAQRRQSGSNYNAEPHHSPSRWRVDVQNSTPKCMAR